MVSLTQMCQMHNEVPAHFNLIVRNRLHAVYLIRQFGHGKS